MSNRIFQGIVIALVLSSQSVLALAQQAQAPAQKESEYVEHKEFKSKIIELKNREPREVVRILSNLGSGFKGAKVTTNPGYSSITVRDFPENIAAIEEAVKRLDVPAAPKPAVRDVEITAYILVASNQEGSPNQYPAPLREVVTQLQNTLGFKSYQLFTPLVQRTGTINGSLGITGTSVMPGGSFSGRYELIISNINWENRDQASSNLALRRVMLQLRGSSDDDYRMIGEAKITTDLNVKENEKVVVGTASLKDRALILVLMAKTLN